MFTRSHGAGDLFIVFEKNYSDTSIQDAEYMVSKVRIKHNLQVFLAFVAFLRSPALLLPLLTLADGPSHQQHGSLQQGFLTLLLT